MTDADRRRAERTAREFAETEGAFADVRSALVSRLFASPLDASAERERLYLAVQVLDSVRGRMKAIIAGAGDNKAIEEFVAAMKP